MRGVRTEDSRTATAPLGPGDLVTSVRAAVVAAVAMIVLVSYVRPIQSSVVNVGVRPRVTAALVGSASVQRGRVVAFTGRVQPRKRRILLLVDRQGRDGAYRRIARKPIRVLRSGGVRARYRFRKPGRYRVLLGAEPDALNLRARSVSLTVTVL